MRKLFHGDNLSVLREHLPDESVHLVYLDPPFNSRRDYPARGEGHVPAKATGGRAPVFTDTWRWDEAAERDYEAALRHEGAQDGAARALAALEAILPRSGMMAYLAMMAVRLLELRRVLKPTGSLYLHCDPTASL